MPPKAAFDPLAIHYICMKVVGGEAAPAAALAPKCSPIGMPPKTVADSIQKSTGAWKGMKVEVEVKIQNKQCEVRVLPTAAPLILKALKEPARDRKKTKNIVHNGNLKLEQIIEIAKEMRPKSMSAEFEGTVLEVVGTAVSVGCTINGENPKKITAGIKSGEIDVTA
jgi:large subunit ribosomal protein L12e